MTRGNAGRVYLHLCGLSRREKARHEVPGEWVRLFRPRESWLFAPVCVVCRNGISSRCSRTTSCPANAAAWYMAKRRFYLSSYSERLLPQLLRTHPGSSAVDAQRNEVKLLEQYTKDVIFTSVSCFPALDVAFSPQVAKHKLQYLVQYGLFAYFLHKADEYGVYFSTPLLRDQGALSHQPPHGHERVVCQKEAVFVVLQEVEVALSFCATFGISASSISKDPIEVNCYGASGPW